MQRPARLVCKEKKSVTFWCTSLSSTRFCVSSYHPLLLPSVSLTRCVAVHCQRYGGYIKVDVDLDKKGERCYIKSYSWTKVNKNGALQCREEPWGRERENGRYINR
ncbi:hypothetical protein ATANTOWER_022766 [Ataeniobius toweri]|uniref:Uncharacterized protein n=1 Tax=Ataeniobius toweri TaxID=208326 RepID=A0ABU7B342_9TELE|nr:hypothetical protein [Ataeniobius toweri]